MSSWSLRCHQSSPSTAVRGVRVLLQWQANDALLLQFSIDADTAQVQWPVPAEPVFTDGLWRHSCCELFVGSEGLGYREFNFSPSSQFAIYDFDGYRAGMRAAPCTVAPQISAGPDALSLRVLLDAELLPRASAAPQSLGLTAVIEEREGYHSYWALSHAGPKPDFHDRAGFIVPWSAIERAGARAE